MNIVAFYSHQGTDDKGRTLKQLWEMTNDQLENSHDVIQRLFPLPEPSKHDPNAPILDEKTIAAFRSDKALRYNLAKSFVGFVNFLGYRTKVEDGEVKITRAGSIFDIAKKNWLRPRNHNFLRVTRVIRSMKLLGLSNCAKALLEAMEELAESPDGKVIPVNTIVFWQDAYETDA